MADLGSGGGYLGHRLTQLRQAGYPAPVLASLLHLKMIVDDDSIDRQEAATLCGLLPLFA